MILFVTTPFFFCFQTAANEKAAHTTAKNQFFVSLRDFESWLTNAQDEIDTAVASSIDKDGVDAQVRCNRALQEELDRRRDVLADLQLQCDNLCQRENAPQARELRARLRELETQCASVTGDVNKKAEVLKKSLKESERIQEAISEREHEMESLSSWLQNNRQLREEPQPPPAPTVDTPTSHDVTTPSRLLVKNVEQLLSSKTSSRDVSDDSDNEDSVVSKWRRLRREAEQRTRRLEEELEKSRPVPYFAHPLSHFRFDEDDSSNPEMSSSEQRADDVRCCLDQLRSCWRDVQQQLHDSEERLRQVDDFQNLYQNALQSISQWLDDIEERLFATSNWHDATSDCLQQTEALQDELVSLQQEITNMNQASQQLLAEAGAENRTLIRQTVEELNTRLRMLEEQVRAKEAQLEKQQQQQHGTLERVHDVSRRMTGATLFCCSELCLSFNQFLHCF